MCKIIFGRNFVHSKFSCVRSSHDMCARAHAHSVEVTLLSSQTGCHKSTERKHTLVALVKQGNSKISTKVKYPTALVAMQKMNIQLY